MHLAKQLWRTICVTGCLALWLAAALVSEATVIAYWRFEPGALTVDSTGHGHDLTNVGVTSGAPAPGVGGAGSASLDGSQTVFSTANPLNLSSYNALTIEWWSKTTQTSPGVIWEQTANYNNTPGAMVAGHNGEAPGKVSVDQNDARPPSYPVYREDITELSGWNHYAITIDNSQAGVGHMEFFLNGVAMGNNYWIGANAPPLPSFVNDYFFIGSRDNTTAKYVGLIDELRISDQILSPSEFLLVPEPSTITLLGLGALLVFRRSRRKG